MLTDLNRANLDALVVAVIRLVTDDSSRCYADWIDELEQGVLELLAAQADLPVILASTLGEQLGRGSTENGMREFARKTLGTVAALADNASWTPKEFAAPQIGVMAQYFSAAELWAR